MADLKRICLIDDDEDDCFIFETALAELGHPVEFIFERDAEVALAKLHNGYTPDLLFLDWNMPKYTGMDVLITIRKTPGLDSIPVIIYTTTEIKSAKDEAMRLGASYFLSKQSTLRELLKKLQHILSLDWTVDHSN